MYDVIIIGGGAAGTLAAITSAKNGKKAIIIESNGYIGKKLMITGKGRCNITNNCGIDELMKNIPTNSRFLYSAFSQFSPYDTISFFESMGVPLKTERGNRVFPKSDNARDVTSALEKQLKALSVPIKTQKASEILLDSSLKKCIGVKCADEEYYSKSVIIATGGKSYPKTGSTGDGYKLSRMCGHTITELKPSLVPLETAEKYCSDMMGLSLKNVTLSLYHADKCIFSELGEMLFTHFGISGPLVLSASAHIGNILPNKYKILIDLKPALDAEKLDLRIQNDFNENKNKSFINSLGKLLPAKMIPTAAALSGIPFQLKVNSITREQRKHLVSVIKAIPITITKFRPIEEAVITSGGISVNEINPKTMESKIIKNLFFAGEVIDVDAYTGGFNLQIAFSTGYAAGLNAGGN